MPPVLASRTLTAEGREFMVAAPTPQAMEAGRAILERGGNAVDAAAAIAAALWVTDPLMSSVGGRSQILIRMADGTTVGIDGATQAPLRVGEPADLGHGYGTVPIPGSPAAVEEMLSRFGTLSWQDVLQPAIRLAEEGFPLPPDVHDALVNYEDRLSLYPGTRAHFYKEGGEAYEVGEVFRQPALAQTLRTLGREGPDALYRGSLADAFVADMEAHGGLVQLDDLEQYTPLAGEVVHGEYRGHPIVARGGNCDGASVIEMLQILEHFDLAAMDREAPEYIHILAQTLYLAGQDEYVDDSIQVSPAHAAERAQEVESGGFLSAAGVSAGPHGDTNHLSVVDGAGNSVAMTQSIGPSFGSKVASPELGFFYAYSYDMNDEPVPYQREKTSQSPTMILAHDNPYLVLGSAGSSRIPGSIVRTVVNVVEHGMTLAEAVAGRRWYVAEGELRIEGPSLPDATVTALEDMGYQIHLYPELDGYFARVHAVMIDPGTGVLWGASDPRDLGAAGGR
jgi:gamma-glutamyltranspeptidase/glutathione hydrolase